MFWSSLSRRLSAVFAVLLLVCCGASAWLQMRSNGIHEQEVVQRLSIGLAAHIAENSELMNPDGLNQPAVKDLFDKLMAVNPSVEVYLLGLDGRIKAQAAPEGHLKRDTVGLEPIRKLLLQQFMGEKFGRDSIWESHLATELWSTKVDIEAILDEQTMPLNQVMNLEVGQTLMLGATPDSKIKLRCRGVPLLTGRMGRVGASVAVKVDEAIQRTDASRSL